MKSKHTQKDISHLLFIDVTFTAMIISLAKTMKIIVIEQLIFCQGISNYLAFVVQFHHKSYLVKYCVLL